VTLGAEVWRSHGPHQRSVERVEGVSFVAAWSVVPGWGGQQSDPVDGTASGWAVEDAALAPSCGRRRRCRSAAAVTARTTRVARVAIRPVWALIQVLAVADQAARSPRGAAVSPVAAGYQYQAR
jgi:hypothetical protein